MTKAKAKAAPRKKKAPVVRKRIRLKKPDEKISEPAELRAAAHIETLQGKYCNIANVNHSKHEFAFDFILNVGGESILVSRVLTSPAHAKAIAEVLESNIQKYEKKFGEIPAFSD